MRKALTALTVVTILALVGATGYLYVDNKDLNRQISETAEQKDQRLVDEVNKVFTLPEEAPIVGVVSDLEKFLNTYPTLDKAELGDKLLFFRKARINILYRESDKKVVQTAEVQVPIAVEVIGSQESIDNVAADLVKDFGNQITITKTVKGGITQSFVFDVDADQSSETKTIADILKYEVGSTLPSSIEPGSVTEVVIVVAGETKTETPTTTEQSAE